MAGTIDALSAGMRTKRAWVILAVLALGACGGEATTNSSAGGGGNSGSSGSGAGGSGAVVGTGGSGAIAGMSGSGAGGTGGSACDDPSAKTCSGAGQCVLATSNCCLCGVPEITDYVAMNLASAPKCTCEGPACGCASMDNPNLAASCESGQCAAWDVRQRDDYSACKVDGDCKLRAGLGCCEACVASEYNLVAIRQDAQSPIVQAVCSPAADCPDCVVQYPSNASAACVAGHCKVVIAP